jgi:hypothetical protein
MKKIDLLWALALFISTFALLVGWASGNSSLYWAAIGSIFVAWVYTETQLIKKKIERDLKNSSDKIQEKKGNSKNN